MEKKSEGLCDELEFINLMLQNVIVLPSDSLIQHILSRIEQTT